MPGESVILLDIGNSLTSVALERSGKLKRLPAVPTAEVTSVRRAVTALRRVTGRDRCHAAVLSSVVPDAKKFWLQGLKKFCTGRVLRVHHRMKFGFPLKYPKPESLGTDRLASACGAVHRHGTPVIVADFGTATTFDVVLGKQGFIGGVIAPGWGLLSDYLAERTAMLPKVEPRPLRRPVGKSTAEAMAMGALWSGIGMVEEITAQLKRRNRLKRPALCATGGWARQALKAVDVPYLVEPDLTLYGLACIYRLNVKE